MMLISSQSDIEAPTVTSQHDEEVQAGATEVSMQKHLLIEIFSTFFAHLTGFEI